MLNIDGQKNDDRLFVSTKGYEVKSVIAAEFQ